ncbi:hypothetical protein [Synechococcus sp. KORDI-100]|nr:hypothetical protein [Synechococcus sp. KORDI-100]
MPSPGSTSVSEAVPAILDLLMRRPSGGALGSTTDTLASGL